MKFFNRPNVVAPEIAIGSADNVDDAEKNLDQKVEPSRSRPNDSEQDSLERVPSRDVQAGVQAVEAVTLTWTRNQLILAYFLCVPFAGHRKGYRADQYRSVFLVFFVVSMEEQIQNNLGVYVTSTFALLPLTSTTSIVSSIVGGVVKLPTAKFIDLIGRAQGFAIMTGLATIGTCSNPPGAPCPFRIVANFL